RGVTSVCVRPRGRTGGSAMGITRVGSEFRVNTQTTGDQYSPDIATLTNGNFVVTWNDYNGGNSNTVRAQLFDAPGTKIGSEFQVDTIAASQANNLGTVTGLSGGGFVITWQWFDVDSDIHAQVFNADGTRVGSEFQVNTNTASDQDLPQIAALNNG